MVYDNDLLPELIFDVTLLFRPSVPLVLPVEPALPRRLLAEARGTPVGLVKSTSSCAFCAAENI